MIYINITSFAVISYFFPILCFVLSRKYIYIYIYIYTYIYAARNAKVTSASNVYEKTVMKQKKKGFQKRI